MIVQDVKNLLAKQPFFAGVDRKVVGVFAELGEPQSFTIGKTIVAEGDAGDAAYLIYSGKVRIVKSSGQKDSITLAVRGRGEFFGERAILAGEPREATVRASEDVIVVRFDRKDFQAMCQGHPELQAYFDKLIEDRGLTEFLRTNTILDALPPKQVRGVIESLKPCSFGAGETIILEGDGSEQMYIIKSGEVKVSKLKDGEQRTLAFLGEGEYFGELALLADTKRAATVTATEHTDCLTLGKNVFLEIIERAPKLKEKLLKRLSEYDVDPALAERYALKAQTGAFQRNSPAYKTAPKSRETPQPADKPIKPKRGLFKKFPWIRQYDETDCGAACLAMISRYYGKRLSVARLRDLANVGREGASMFSLANAAEAIGFSTRAVRTDFDHLIKLELPAIAHWKGYHYIVVYEATPHRVVIGDPGIGVLRLTPEEFKEGWTQRLLMVSPTSALLEQEEQKTTVRRFLPLLRPYRMLLLEVLLASLLINLFGLAVPFFTQNIIDKVLVHQDVQMLNMMLGGMLLIGVFTIATTLLRRYLLIHISQKLSLRLASDLFSYVMKLPMSFFGKRKIGDILTRFGDNHKVQDLITGSAINTLLDVIMVVVYLSVMLAYNAKLTGVALIFIPLSIGLTLILTPMMRRNNERLFEKEATSQSKLIESIEKVGHIKTATAELPTRWKYEDFIVQRANQAFEGAKLGMVMDGVSSALQLLSTTVVLWYGAHLVISGEISVGQLIAFNVLIGMVMAPILGLVGMWQRLQDAFLSLQRLSDIYDAEPEEPGTVESSLLHLPELQGHIEFKDVSFRYGSDDGNVLSNVDLEVRPGQTVALVGRSGSGKTTLISLLQRLYRPTEGRIFIDGYDISGASGASLRAQLGVVTQDSSIFTGTIRENIALGDPNAPLARVIAAAKLANAHDFISEYPLGYDTVVGEIGIGLSGGQRQRVCIARALLTDPRIILFDEATSALDTESERAIQENMDAILEGHTAIIIAHRLSTVRNADRIVVMDQGRIVEQGSHGELMAARGLYYYLHTQQLGG